MHNSEILEKIGRVVTARKSLMTSNQIQMDKIGHIIEDKCVTNADFKRHSQPYDWLELSGVNHPSQQSRPRGKRGQEDELDSRGVRSSEAVQREANSGVGRWGTYYGNRYSFAFPSPDCDAATKKKKHK